MAVLRQATANGVRMQIGSGTLASGTLAINTPFSKVFHVSVTFTEDPAADGRTRWSFTAGVVTITDNVQAKAFSYVIYGE